MLVTRRTIFLDAETGGTRPKDAPWEVALVTDMPDGSHERRVLVLADFDPTKADPFALQMNGFYDRHPAWNGQEAERGYDDGTGETDLDTPVYHELLVELHAAHRLEYLTRGALVVVNNPVFDKPRLERLMNRHQVPWTAHYKPVCGHTYAAGVAGLPPDASTLDVGAHFGIDPASYGVKHAALPDALYLRAVYLAARARAIANTASTDALNTPGSTP